MSENKLIREAARASRARELLDNDLLVEAFDNLEASYLEAWKNAPARDAEGREHIWFMIRSLTAVRGHLTTVVETGKMAEEQLRALRSN